MTTERLLKRIIIRFIKWTVVVILILIVISYFLMERIKHSYGFKELSVDSIDYAVLYKYDFIKLDNGFTERNRLKDSLILEKPQIKKLVRKWNNSYPVGNLGNTYLNLI